MITVMKFTNGKKKGWNIRKLKDGTFVPYIGIVSQCDHPFETLEQCYDWIEKQTT